jgi:hypothetical protein
MNFEFRIENYINFPLFFLNSQVKVWNYQVLICKDIENLQLNSYLFFVIKKPSDKIARRFRIIAYFLKVINDSLLFFYFDFLLLLVLVSNTYHYSNYSYLKE